MTSNKVTKAEFKEFIIAWIVTYGNNPISGQKFLNLVNNGGFENIPRFMNFLHPYFNCSGLNNVDIVITPEGFNLLKEK